MWETELGIEGMTCSSCTTAVTNALLAIGDVISVDVSLMEKKARIRRRGQTSSSSLAEAVEGIGFGVSVLADTDLPSESEEGRGIICIDMHNFV